MPEWWTQFKFTEAISFSIDCETQDEVDEYWEKLTAGGQESMCGWLKDKFGLSWQVVPRKLGEMMGDKDPEKATSHERNAANEKIDIAVLKQAYDGK